MKKLLTAILLLFPAMLMASEDGNIKGETQGVSLRDKLHFDLAYNFSYATSQRIYGRKYDRDTYTMDGVTWKFTVRYDVSRQWSAGLGMGASWYSGPHLETFPVYATVQYKPFKKIDNLFAYSDIGFSAKLSDSDHHGFNGGIGIGYRWKLKRRFGINFTAGYEFRDFRHITSYRYDEVTGEATERKNHCTRHSLSIGVGMTF